MAPQLLEEVVRHRPIPWWRREVSLPVWLFLLILASGTFYWIDYLVRVGL